MAISGKLGFEMYALILNRREQTITFCPRCRAEALIVTRHPQLAALKTIRVCCEACQHHEWYDRPPGFREQPPEQPRPKPQITFAARDPDITLALDPIRQNEAFLTMAAEHQERVRKIIRIKPPRPWPHPRFRRGWRDGDRRVIRFKVSS